MPEPSRGGRRQHFGTGTLAIDPATAVFINCPFDVQYEPLFYAIVFATTCCGFLPRSALESGNVSEPRMDRIVRAIFSSKYSIHDLCRCRGEGDEALARFNMPLELGIAMARKFSGRQGQVEHDWLILVPAGHQYVRFISDLAGYDPKTHNGTVDEVVPRVILWLATRPDAVLTPSPRAVLTALPAFLNKQEELKREWAGEIPWADLVVAARNLVPPIPA